MISDNTYYKETFPFTGNIRTILSSYLVNIAAVSKDSEKSVSKHNIS